MEIIELIDILGIAAFSISGAFAAMEKKLDVFGIFVMAFITALGGGTLRDVLIGNLPVSWMHNLNYSLVVFVSFLAAVLFSNLIRNYHQLLWLFDSLGLGLFTIIGIQKGIQAELHPVMCVTLGTITACFGGIIRDVVLNNIPLIFQKEIYASACIAGGIIYFLLIRAGLSGLPADVIAITFIFLIRVLGVRYHWKLPVVTHNDNKLNKS